VADTRGDGTGSPGPVDYDHIARRYQEGRALTDPALDLWWAAASRFLPTTRPLTVLDLGAGTGIFARAWPRWCDCRVIAVEPSEGMRSEAVEAGMPFPVALMAGEGEAVGLRSGSVDVAWLSTVIHHFKDRRAGVEELGRVVRSGGTVLVRGFFADRGEVGWLQFFPGADAARSRFPSTTAISALFSDCGFEPVGAVDVDGHLYETARAAASWARRMRHADTLLGAFSDEDFRQGVAALDASASDQALANRLTLLAFTNR